MSEILTRDMPITIVKTKFKGTHPRFFYAAFFLRGQDLPFGFGDVESAEIAFWQTYNFLSFPVGTGNTPGSAIKDLYRRQRFINDHVRKLGDKNDKNNEAEASE